MTNNKNPAELLWGCVLPRRRRCCGDRAPRCRCSFNNSELSTAHDSVMGSTREASASPSEPEDDGEALQIIVAIDIGSSSTRCSAWRVVVRASGAADASDDDGSKTLAAQVPAQSSTSVPPTCVTPILVPPQRRRIHIFTNDGDDGDQRRATVASAVRQLSALDPVTGRIRSVSELLDAVDDVVQETLERIRELSSNSWEVAGVGFTSFVMNLVGVDGNGVPINDELATLSYACNTPEVTGQVKALKRQLKHENRLHDVYETTGAPLHASYALGQLRNLYDCHPQVAERVAHWQTLSSCCLSRWLGIPKVPISYSEASWTGLLDYRTCQYADCLRDLLPTECWTALPDLCDYDDFSQRGLPENSYYDRWPELRHSRFFLGVGDGACATIGSKCAGPHRIACTIGTSAAARMCVHWPASSWDDADLRNGPANIDDSKKLATHTRDAFVPGLFCYRVDKIRVVVGGALTDGGSVIEWARQLLNLDSSPEAFEACLCEVEERVNAELTAALTKETEDESRPASRSSLTFVPFLSGERNPGFRDTASGCLLGLRRATKPSHVLQSCLEGVTLRIRSIVQLLLPSDDSDNAVRIVASGGALEKNALWRQMLADCTGLQVVLDEDSSTESTSRGVAILVAKALSTLPSSDAADVSAASSLPSSLAVGEEALTPTLVSIPRPIASRYWKRLELEQDRLLEALSPLYDESGDA